MPDPETSALRAEVAALRMQVAADHAQIIALLRTLVAHTAPAPPQPTVLSERLHVNGGGRSYRRF